MRFFSSLAATFMVLFFASSSWAITGPDANLSKIRTNMERSEHKRFQLAAKALGDDDFIHFLKNLLTEPDTDLELKEILRKLKD